VLLGAALAALVWVNVHASSYEELWETTLSIDLGSLRVSLSLREWVNSGLMTIVFFVLGLEARREFDLGKLRERRRFALPLLAALGGMAVPVTIYLLVNLGSAVLDDRDRRVDRSAHVVALRIEIDVEVSERLAGSEQGPGARTPRQQRRRPEEHPGQDDFECPYCGQAEPVVRELLREFGDVAYVWRHLPLADVHPHAQLAAEAAEAASDQGAFWEMHDLLLDHQDALRPDHLVGYAEQLGLDLDRFTTALHEHAGAGRVAEDVDGAELSGVSGTPTFFINGRRHYGAYDIATLSAAVRAAGARATLAMAAAD
jgi:Na+/H+ antiporter 1/DSBA-like thioredoxin domain-containing protein